MRSADSRPVLVTGAFGSLGTRVTRQLASRGVHVIALDLQTPATERLAARMSSAGSVEPAWIDLTDADAVREHISRANPRAVLHLAAIIPPMAYVRPALAERVNVGGTQNVIDALAAQHDPGRLVLASSLAVYGSRNGARDLGLLDANTAVRPRDVYGAHKAKAEAMLRASSLDWAILRLGGIIATDLFSGMDRSSLFMQGIIPADNRIHTVWVEDVATAFVSAIDAECSGMTLLIGGDESHKLRQNEFNGHMLAMAGMGAPRPQHGWPGNPADDDAWFITDWMDTTDTVEVLRWHRLSIEQTTALVKAELGRRRIVLRPAGPLVRAGLRLASPYRGSSSGYADPWRLVEARYGREALA